MSESKDGRQLLRELTPRSAGVQMESALGIAENPYPSLFEDTAFFRFVKGIDIRHTTPELRFTELDQADPAGRFRLRVNGDEFMFDHASAAGWAGTADNLLTVTNSAFASTKETTWGINWGLIVGNNTVSTDPWGQYVINQFNRSLAITAGNSANYFVLAQLQNSIDATNTKNLTAAPGWTTLDFLDGISGSGTITDARGIRMRRSVNAGATVTDWSGLYIENPTGAGTLTNNYGIYIAAQTKGGTLNRAIYVAGGISEFDGVIQADGGVTGSLTGNAATATKLATARAINGVDFDGSAPITITAAAGTLTGTILNATVVTSSLTSVGTLASPVLTTPDINGGTSDSHTSLSIRDTSAAFDVTLAATSNPILSAGRTLTLNMGNVAHTLDFGGTAGTLTFPTGTKTVPDTTSTWAASLITGATFAAGTFSFSGSTISTLGTVSGGTLGGTTINTSTLNSPIIQGIVNAGTGLTMPGLTLNAALQLAPIAYQIIGGDTGTGRTYGSFTNTGGQFIWGIESSVGNSVLLGGSAYASVLGSSTNTPLEFATNNNIRVTVDITGNLLVGTTTAPSNTTGAVGLFTGGIAFTDVLNAWIDDASHGTGTVTHYIGNAKILTGNGINFGPAGVASITVVNGQVTAIS